MFPVTSYNVSHIGNLAVCAQVDAAQGACPQKTSGAILDRKLSCEHDHFSTRSTAWWTAQAVNIVCAFHLAFLSFRLLC